MLEHIYIERPCAESLQDVGGNPQLKSCDKCSIPIYDLSKFARQEAEELLAQKIGKERICLTFDRDSNGRIRTSESYQPNWLKHFARLRFSLASWCASLTVALHAQAVSAAPIKYDPRGSYPKPTVESDVSPPREDCRPDTGRTLRGSARTAVFPTTSVSAEERLHLHAKFWLAKHESGTKGCVSLFTQPTIFNAPVNPLPKSQSITLAKSLLTEAIACARQNGMKAELICSLNNLANLSLYEGNYSEAEEIYKEAIGLCVNKETRDIYCDTIENNYAQLLRIRSKTKIEKGITKPILSWITNTFGAVQLTVPDDP